MGTSAYYLKFQYSEVISAISIGISLFYIAPNLPEGIAFLLQGLGLGIPMYLLSNVIEPLRPMFHYASILTVLGYTLASLEGFRILKGSVFRENVKAFPIAGLLFGAYSVDISNLGVVGFLLRLFSLILSLYLISSLALLGISKKSEEEVIVGNLDIKFFEKSFEDPMLKEAEDAVKEFIVKGDKAPIITYIAFYGAQAGLSRERIEEIIRPILNYRRREYSILTPKWWKVMMEKREVKRREELIKGILRRLER
ncbi:hypothetical protein CHITON_1154 [Thermococcus chitonophagus]|nr:hypothetical protein CHITON_1154 [Thermococcus chitonophagus]